MKKIILTAIVALSIYPCRIYAQKISTFSIDLSPGENALDIPVSVNLDSITKLAAGALSLSEISGNKTRPIPFQVTQDKQRTLHWIVGHDLLTKRIYRLTRSAPAVFDIIEDVTNNGAVTIRSGNRNLLNYQFQTVYPPAGIDTNYKRSGFIHPLYTPNGQELTRIQPPDHYHHYGIWNPWTHTLFEKDTVDFWNIKDRTGTVRFAGFVSQTNGPVFSEYKVLHEHVAFKKSGEEKIAINELQTVRVYKPGTGYYVADITSELTCGTESPILLLTYRYGGLGWRATEFWDKDNCEVLTSEGKTRKDTDGSKARWCIVQGALPGKDSGGAVMLSYPANYNHPEPLRIWDELANGGRGDMFANFAPTKDKDWLLEPGKTYTLKYRLVVFNGKFDAAKAESAWQNFATPPVVKIGK
jgi:Methane oxygenase PmoA